MKILEALAEEGFCRVADAQTSRGNSVKLLKDGPETYPAWLDAIRNAKTSVHLENYIIQSDAVGNEFAEALIGAAGRGVSCKVLYDWLGCLTRTKRAFWRRLRAAGIEVRRYNRPHISSPFGWVSRDHRKVLCVDHKVAFTGGLCIGHDWMGDAAKGIPPWRDTAIEIRGTAVKDICEAFADSWAAAGHGIPHVDQNEMDASPEDGIEISVVAGRPRSMGLYRLEQLVAEIAETRLWLTDGYFVATTSYVRALTDAAKAGVDVRLLVPGSSNWPMVGALSKAAYRPLLEAGVRVFEWNGPMLHAKTAVADGCWTRIGSSNSNVASWISNRELDVTIKDGDLAGQMERLFEDDMTNATEVVLRQGRSGIMKPVPKEAPDDAQAQGSSNTGSASRLASGAIGLGSTLGAALSQKRPLGEQEALVVTGGGGALVALALLAIFFPRVIAFPIAAVAIYFAIGLMAHALRLRKAGHETGPR